MDYFSRCNDDAEIEKMAKTGGALPAHLASFVDSIFCDSKACATYTVSVRIDCPLATGEEIAKILEENSGGHNGITIALEGGPSLCRREPGWPGDFDDID